MTDLICLALAVYYEARSESIRAQIAVAQVVVQRAESQLYPDNVCDVVKDGEYYANGHPIRHRCQFSFWCDGLGETPTDMDSWRTARAVASVVLNGYRIPELEGVVHYHAEYVAPLWAANMTEAAREGAHVFLR